MNGIAALIFGLWCIYWAITAYRVILLSNHGKKAIVRANDASDRLIEQGKTWKAAFMWYDEQNTNFMDVLKWRKWSYYDCYKGDPYTFAISKNKTAVMGQKVVEFGRHDW